MAWKFELTTRDGVVHPEAYARVEFFSISVSGKEICAVFDVWHNQECRQSGRNLIDKFSLKISAAPVMATPAVFDADGNEVTPATYLPTFDEIINSQAGGQLYTSIAGLIYQNSAALPQFSEATMV